MTQEYMPEGTLLSEKEIISRMRITGDLIVRPTLNLNQQINATSLDVRLGRMFLSQRRTSLLQVDPLAAKEQINQELLKSLDYFTIAAHEPYILHPGDFVLGTTLEFIEIPDDLVGRLEGRSSWARKGLQVHATAGSIDPGYQGLITFELSNVSTLPLSLYPMWRIGQLSFYKLHHDAVLSYGAKRGHKYFGDLLVTASRAHEDKEYDVINWLRRQDQRRTGDN